MGGVRLMHARRVALADDSVRGICLHCGGVLAVNERLKSLAHASPTCSPFRIAVAKAESLEDAKAATLKPVVSHAT